MAQPAFAQEQAVAGADDVPTLIITNKPQRQAPAMSANGASGYVNQQIAPAGFAPIYATPNKAPQITPQSVIGKEYYQPVETLANRKLEQIREDLFTLQTKVADLSENLAMIEKASQDLAAGYYASVATISTQLQSGTTPGNPRLLGRLTDAQDALDTLAGTVADLNTLAIEISDAASVSAYLQQSAQAAYALTGSVEEDHANLAKLEDSISNTMVVIERLLNNVNDDISRSSAYLASERGNLRTLALGISNGDLYGRSLANRPFSNVAPTTASFSGQSSGASFGMEAAGRPDQARPLAVIKFDAPDVDYEQAVYTAVNEALQRYPNAQFELVAVNPAQGNPARIAIETTKARRNAEKVLRTLTQFGLKSEQIVLSSLKSENVQGNEVHLYVR